MFRQPTDTVPSILIADDYQPIRETLHRLLERTGFKVCGEAVDGLDAIIKATELAPDLIVLDVRMPNMNGVEAASVLKQRLPQTKVILLSMYEVGIGLSSAAGADAVIHKADGMDLLVDCIRRLLAKPSSTPLSSA
jgi:DNA-binding NarL/FixJ family response regulator